MLFPTIISFLLGTVYFFLRKRTQKNKNKLSTSPAAFDDPTLNKDFFKPDHWVLERVSDGNFKWVETPQPTFVYHGSFDRDVNVNSSDYVFRSSLDAFKARSNVNKAENQFQRAALLGAEFYGHVSQSTGCVPNDYGGPLFLLPGYIIASYVCGEQARERLLSKGTRGAMIAYILNHQQEDGGWGTHISGTSTCFGSVLNYVALRLLGVRATHPRACKARMFLASRDGAVGAPLWAKMWLAVLGVYDYRGVSPVPPEMWLLPDWFPFHPGKTWCHARMVALPLSYLYGARFVYADAETDATIAQLRVELYPVHGPYEDVNWTWASEYLYPGELYGQKASPILKFGNIVLRWLLESTWLGNKDSFLRSVALKRAFRHLKDEDQTNEYICIGPVNKTLNMVCSYAGGDDKAVLRHIDTMERYLWVAEDGMKMQGYLNSMIWDSSFTLLALCSLMKKRVKEGNFDEREQALMKFAKETNDFIARNQCDRDPTLTQQYRDPCKGGWGFSTKENTYTVSDCTSEGLRAILTYADLTGTTPSADVNAAVDLILWMQNEDDHAWASYEKRRGYRWYELLNPAAMFGDIMIDYSYTECTSSCILALVSFIQYAKNNEPVRVAKSKVAIQQATEYLFNRQKPDGSFFGEWGVCFTYGTMFAMESLTAAHQIGLVEETKLQSCYIQVLQFLMSKQNQDGGWGESVDACALKIWVPDPAGSNTVNTAWSLISLCKILNNKQLLSEELYSKGRICANGAARYLTEQQDEFGDWAQPSSIAGVFNKTCGITYTSYRNSFPIKALAEYSLLF